MSHPIPWDVSHGIPIGMTFPWTSLPFSKAEELSREFPGRTTTAVNR